MKKAFTFVELILYTALVGIVLTAMVRFALAVMVGNTKAVVKEEVYGSGRYVAERLQYEIRNALDIDTGNSDFGINLVSVGGSKITLRSTPGRDPVVIDVVGDQIRIKEGAAVAVPLSPTSVRVTNLTFENYSSGDGSTKNLKFTVSLDTGAALEGQEYKGDVTISSSAEVRTN